MQLADTLQSFISFILSVLLQEHLNVKGLTFQVGCIAQAMICQSTSSDIPTPAPLPAASLWHERHTKNGAL